MVILKKSCNLRCYNSAMCELSTLLNLLKLLKIAMGGRRQCLLPGPYKTPSCRPFLFLVAFILYHVELDEKSKLFICENRPFIDRFIEKKHQSYKRSYSVEVIVSMSKDDKTPFWMIGTYLWPGNISKECTQQ